MAHGGGASPGLPVPMRTSDAHEHTQRRWPESYHDATVAAAGLDGGVHPGGGVHSSRLGTGAGLLLGWLEIVTRRTTPLSPHVFFFAAARFGAGDGGADAGAAAFGAGGGDDDDFCCDTA